MPARKTARRAPAPAIEEPAGDGLAIRIAERALENPAMSGGLLVMGLTAVAIVSNAMFMQSARHPDPLFMTRPAPAVASQPLTSVPIPRPRVEPAAAPVHVAAAPPAEAIIGDESPVSDKPTVAAIQRALLSRGIYKDAVDGRMGSRTRTAILAYQKAEGLKPTGLPSTALLEHLRTAAVRPVVVAPRQPSAPVKLPPEPIGKPAASAAPAATPLAAVKPAALPVAAAETPAPDPIAAVAAPEEIPAPPVEAAPAVQPAVVAAVPAPSEAAVAAARRTIGVQNALNQSGYGPVPNDGLLNDETVNAIRRFELDNGMAITGRISDQLINKLVSIGAMNPA